MEAIAGFIVGYWLGTREGREGLQKMVDSWNEISKSDEFKALVGTAMTLGSGMVRQGIRQSGGSALGGAVGEAFVSALLNRAKGMLGGNPGLRVVS
jgi:hypothetical protein